ncbi:MAG: Uma2 family endonuclease [Bryobacteraceae bacterium]
MTHLALINPLLFSPGDRLSREEFLDLWEQMPGLKFAELIDGIVYMPSPLSIEHGSQDFDMHGWVFNYQLHTPVFQGVANATWLMLESAPQPDTALRLLPEFGGRTTVQDKLASGAPELVIEVCHSSRSYDLGPKLSLYQRADVNEYIALLIKEKRVEWRVLEAGSYRLLKPDEAGVFRSKIFPGLWLDESALWRNDAKRLIEVLNQGLHSDEHAAFLKRLGVERP